MIDWLLNDILWGWGRKRAYVLSVVFLGTGLAYCNASMHHAYLEISGTR